MITIDSVVHVSQDQVSSDLGEETVILGVKNGIYYSLDQVGMRIWNLIQHPQRVAVVRDLLLEEYKVDREQCEHDLISLLEELHAVGLVEIHDATTT